MHATSERYPYKCSLSENYTRLTRNQADMDSLVLRDALLGVMSVSDRWDN